MLRMKAAEEMTSQLKEKGWNVYGFTPDRSDAMTDLFMPATWGGIAEKDGYILLVDVYGTHGSGKKVTEKTFTPDPSKVQKLRTLIERGATEGEKQAAQTQLDKLYKKEEENTVLKYEYPTFSQGNPKKCTWHVEKDGEIVAKGVGASDDNLNSGNYSEREEKVSKLIKRIEKRISDNKELVPVEKKEITKTIKPVQINISLDQVVENETHIVIDKPLTNGVGRGFVYVLKRISEGKKGNYYEFIRLNKKLNKRLTGLSNPANSIHMHGDNFNKLFEKGCFHFANLEEVEEVTYKTVYVSKQRQQKENLLNGTQEEEPKQDPEVKAENKEQQATNKQLFALHMASNNEVDTRGLYITKEKASDLISRSKSGENITDELKHLAGLDVEENTNDQVILENEEYTYSMPQEAIDEGLITEEEYKKAFDIHVRANRNINNVTDEERKYRKEVLKRLNSLYELEENKNIPSQSQTVEEDKEEKEINLSNDEARDLENKFVYKNATSEEENKLERYHLQLQEKALSYKDSLKDYESIIDNEKVYHVLSIVNKDNGSIGQFENELTGQELKNELLVNNILDIYTPLEKQTEAPEEPQTENHINIDPSIVEESEELEATYYINEDRNGLEVSFNDKPSQELRELLKHSYGFKWAKYNKVWYCKQSKEYLQFVKALCNQEEGETVSHEPVSYPHIEIDDLLSYSVSQDLQNREHDANWIFRRSKRDHTKEIRELFKHYNEQVEDVLSKTENEKIIYYLKRDLQRFKKKYHANYEKMLRVKSENPSWAVTGRANRNVRKHEKAMSQYDNLMGESVSFTDWIDKRIKKTKQDIRRDEEKQVKEAFESSNIELVTFKTETKEVKEFHNNQVKKRFYIYDDYAICKLWNKFRVYYKGKEIETPLKTTSKLTDAKRYVSYLVQSNKDQEKAG